MFLHTIRRKLRYILNLIAARHIPTKYVWPVQLHFLHINKLIHGKYLNLPSSWQVNVVHLYTHIQELYAITFWNAQSRFFSTYIKVAMQFLVGGGNWSVRNITDISVSNWQTFSHLYLPESDFDQKYFELKFSTETLCSGSMGATWTIWPMGPQGLEVWELLRQLGHWGQGYWNIRSFLVCVFIGTL